MTDYVNKVVTFLPEMTKAITETGLMLGISLLMAVLLGLPLGVGLYLFSQNGRYPNRLLATLGNTYVNIVRSFPFLLLVIALIPLTRLILGTAFGVYAAAIPLSIVSIGIYARLVEQVLLDVPKEVVDLAKSLGVSVFSLFGIFASRSAFGLILSLTSVLISMVSYSTVMGVVGGGGIGDFAIRYGYRRYEYDLMYTTIVLMIIFVMLVQWLGTRWAHQLDKRK